MKRLILIVTAAGALLGQPQKIALTPSAGNRLELKVYKTGLYKGKVHEFLFPAYQGTLSYDPANPSASSVNLSLAAAEIKLTDTWLSAKDFKSVHEYAVKDMLNVAKFNEITFVSSSVRALDALHLEVQGTVTIKGVAKPGVLQVTVNPGPKFEGKAVIKLTDFGLKPPSAALGLIGTKDEMDVSFSMGDLK